MVKVAIVEDSEVYMGRLLEYMERYRGDYGAAIQADSFNDGAVLLENYRSQYDIILMDIEMPLTDGMTAAEEVRRADPEVVIIFITNMPQYAIRGYAVEALDYMLKPLHYFAFSQCLNRAIARMDNRAAKYVSINVNRGTKKLDAADIYYIESNKHMLIFHTARGDFETAGTIRGIEKQFEELRFMRGNSGCLINLRHVDGVEDGCAVINGKLLPLSRSRKGAFMGKLADYIGGALK